MPRVAVSIAYSYYNLNGGPFDGDLICIPSASNRKAMKEVHIADVYGVLKYSLKKHNGSFCYVYNEAMDSFDYRETS